jgi:cytochrome c peroxidase
MRARLAAAGVLLAALAFAQDYQWDLPPGFPQPRVPASNPMSDAKVRLGRYLFYDKRLSANGAQSCATCHRQELAFTDGRATSLGSTGQPHPRSAMSLVNVAYSAVLTWSDPAQRSLEQQALVPMFSDHPVELGLRGHEPDLLAALRRDAVYRELFPKAFPGVADAYTIDNITRALACFERSILSARSPYDRYYYSGDRDAITESAKRGEVLFFTDPVAGCFRCHGGFQFSDAVESQRTALAAPPFHNTGLYNLAGALSYPSLSPGIYEHTRKPADVGRFKTPTLRNIALTAPYMHDGSIATLEEVLDHYAAGGRTLADGPYAGRGHDNPNKDRRIAAIALTPQNREDLLAFLRSLTDTQATRDPRWSDPW